MSDENKVMLSFSHTAVGYGEKHELSDDSYQLTKR